MQPPLPKALQQQLQHCSLQFLDAPAGASLLVLGYPKLGGGETWCMSVRDTTVDSFQCVKIVCNSWHGWPSLSGQHFTAHMPIVPTHNFGYRLW